MATMENILSGRSLLEAYRKRHHKMYQTESADIPAAHELLLRELLEGLSALGFHSLGEFFDDSSLVGDDWR